MKLGRKILLGLAIAVGIAAAIGATAHYRLKGAVEAYRRRLIKQGEVVATGEVPPPPAPPDSNSAAGFGLTVGRLRALQVHDTIPWMKRLGPGRVLLAWPEAELPVNGSSNLWIELERQFTAHSNEMALARETLKKPVPQFETDLRTGSLSGSAPQDLGHSASMLRMGTLLALHDGRNDDAWEDLRASVTLARLYRGDPTEGSQRTRAAAANFAADATWEALQFHGWSEPGLASLQQDWESFNLLDGLEASVVLARDRDAGTFGLIRGAYTNFISFSFAKTGVIPPTAADDIAEVVISPRGAWQSYLNHRPRYWMWTEWWSYREELDRLQVHQAAVEAARAIHAGEHFTTVLNGWNAAGTSPQRVRPPPSQMVLADLTGPDGPMTFLGTMVDAEAGRRMVIAAIALERFRLRHGKYPATLSELNPEFLRVIPADLMSGQPLHYHLQADGSFLLCTAGQDGRADGGAPALPAGVPDNWEAWPVRATAEEVQAYKADTLANAKWQRFRIKHYWFNVPTNELPPELLRAIVTGETN